MTAILVENTPRYEITIDHGGDITVVVTDVPAYELTLATEGVQGPPGPPGPAGPPGPSGAVQQQTFTFASPAAVWTVEHTLPLANPGVYAFDVSGEPIEGDLAFPTATSVRVAWEWPLAGTLVLTT
jgi:hypothetical protein